MNPIITEMSRVKTWKAYVQGNPSVCEYGDNESIAISKLLLRLQGVRVTVISGASVFALAMWICWIALSFLLILEDVQATTFNGMMWGLFLWFGIFGSSYATRK